MARNGEVIRQWEILRDIDAARTGIPIAKIAALRKVHQRSIRRDLDALGRAGFPLFDEKVNGTYLGRMVVAATGGMPLAEEMDRAFAKLESALPEATRKFLDRLPMTIKSKVVGPRKHEARKTRDIFGRLTDAIMLFKRVEMTYDSRSSRATKRYLVEPLRLTTADGGMYLTAWVLACDEARTFALERIRTLAVLDERFEPRTLPPEPFSNSIGVFSGRPEAIEIEFDADIADYVVSREWHRSQEATVRADGSILLRLCVCNDSPLRTWILGFGGAARVVSPKSLANDILVEAEMMRERYMPRLRFEPLRMTLESRTSLLPFSLPKAQ